MRKKNVIAAYNYFESNFVSSIFLNKKNDDTNNDDQQASN